MKKVGFICKTCKKVFASMDNSTEAFLENGPEIEALKREGFKLEFIIEDGWCECNIKKEGNQK